MSSTTQLSPERYCEIIQQAYDEMIRDGIVPSQNKVIEYGIPKQMVRLHWPGSPPAGMKTRCRHCGGMFGPSERSTTYVCNACAKEVRDRTNHNPDAIPVTPLEARIEPLRVHRQYLLDHGIEESMAECARRLGWHQRTIAQLWDLTTPVMLVRHVPVNLDDDPWNDIKFYGVDMPDALHAQCCPLR